MYTFMMSWQHFIYTLGFMGCRIAYAPHHLRTHSQSQPDQGRGEKDVYWMKFGHRRGLDLHPCQAMLPLLACSLHQVDKLFIIGRSSRRRRKLEGHLLSGKHAAMRSLQ